MIDRFVNIYLPFLFDWVIETSVMASVLVGLILCVKVLLRNKLTPRWHYLLWMILVVRLLLPWSPDSSYSIYSLLSYGYKTTTFSQNHPVTSSRNGHVHETKGMSNPEVLIQGTSSLDDPLQATGESREESIHNGKQTDSPLSFYTIASYIWLTGVIILGLTTYIMNRRLHHYIKQQPVITEEGAVRLFNKCKRTMSIQKEIPLLLDGKTVSPAVFGFFRPKVLLSHVHISRLDEQQLQHIFYHELAHIKRKDVGVNWLMHSLLLLNWFNPILWYAYSCMREDQEIACDTLALTFMEEEEKIAYGHTIITLLEHYSSYYPVPGRANLGRNKKSLKRRIFMIKTFQKKSYRWSALGVITVIAVSLLSLLNAHADGKSEQQKDQTAGKAKTTETKEETVYTPPKQQENFKDITKEEILTKMLNTVDNFETAKGEFRIHYDFDPGETVINYELSLNHEEGGYSKEVYKGNEMQNITYRYYHDGISWDLNKNLNTYREEKYIPLTNSKQTLTIQNAFSVDSQGVSVTNARERPIIGQAMSSLFPYEIASNYTRDLNRWEIEKQNEELLGHNTLVIKGILDDYAKRKHKSSTFRFWVDKDTGILMKYETYDSTGKVVNYLYSTKLEVNVPIDSKRFTPDLTGYKKEEMFRTDQPRMTTGNIDDRIPEALKAQWAEAEKKPNETTILQSEGNWYIHVKKGYLVDNIEVNGKEGTLLLAKASPQKSQFVFHALAEGYKVETLKVVYE